MNQERDYYKAIEKPFIVYKGERRAMGSGMREKWGNSYETGNYMNMDYVVPWFVCGELKVPPFLGFIL